MASGPTLRRIAGPLSRAIQDFARTHAWLGDDYRLYLRLNEAWITAHIVLAVQTVPPDEARDRWKELMSFLDHDLHEIFENFNMVSLSLFTFDQVAEGSFHELGPDFVAVEDIVGTRPVS